MFRKTFRIVIPALALAMSLPVAAARAEGGVSLPVNGVQRVSLRGQAASVVVANKDIADVTVADANTIFITGKTVGVSEVVVVDAIGRTLFQSRVVVTGGQPGSVRVWRGATPTEMICNSGCATLGTAGTAEPGGSPSTPTP
jgi:Flp pilus assembly secretin CpaC